MVESVLLPVDVEDPDSLAKPLAMAHRLFRGEAIRLTALYVLPPFEMSIVGAFFPRDFEPKALAKARQRLDDMIARADWDGLPKPETLVAHGVVYEEILSAAAARKVDLVMVCAHRPQLRDYLLGPNAARIARHAKCSVMVLRD